MSKQVKPLKIALMGTRGIPARYGGFETFAEELSTRLVKRGHSVSVYSRRFFGEAKDKEVFYRDVRCVTTPTIRHKYLETPIHSLISFFDLFRNRYDLVLLCNAANSPFAWLVRLRGIPLAINVDGIERMRSKWNALGRFWYRIGEICSVIFANRLVADAEVISEYYKKTYRRASDVIAYGAMPVWREPDNVIPQFELEPGEFILYVSRLEPENNALGVIEAYGNSSAEIPLVIVGDAPYAKSYIESLHNRARDIELENSKKRIVFTGFQFGDAYQELQSHCKIYIQATEVGGTHPALIEAMSYGNCVIANGTPENMEVLGDGGHFYSKNNFSELRDEINKLLNDQDLRKLAGKAAKERIEKFYTWARVTDQYEELFREMVS